MMVKVIPVYFQRKLNLLGVPNRLRLVLSYSLIHDAHLYVVMFGLTERVTYISSKDAKTLSKRNSCRKHPQNSQTPGVASSATSSLACSPATPPGPVRRLSGVITEGCDCVDVSEET